VLPDGSFLIADAGNNRVRLVSASGTISTVAGTGVAGFSGDGGLATAADLNTPKAVAVLPDGTSFLVGDAVNDRVRLVASGGAALTVRVPPLVRSRKGTPAVLPLTLSDRASVALDVVRRSKVVLRVRVTRGRGASRIRFGRTLAAATYQLRLSATAAGGRRAKA